MSREINFSEDAASEIQEALKYLAQYSIPAFNRLTADIDQRCSLLAGQPNLGRKREDLGAGVRSTVIGKYLLFYTFTDDTFYVVRFLHGAMNIPALFKNPS
jgi:toxin ParE1/3/4